MSAGGDFPVPGAFGPVVKSGKQGQDGVVLKGVDEGRYWAVCDERAVGVVAKDQPAPKKRVEAPTSADPQLTPSFITHAGPEIVTGPKGTKVGGRLTEVPIDKGLEPHPHLNQASVSGKTQQRSDTPLGQATPVDPQEPQPKPRQEDVKKVDQRSDTETGEATPFDGDAGPKRQDDAGKKLAQRSATEDGEQTPIGSAEPRGTSSNPDSREQAAGERPTDEKKTAAPAAAKALKKPKGK